MVSTVLSKHSRPDGSFLSAPVTADRIWAALSGAATERVVLILGRTAIINLSGRTVQWSLALNIGK